MDKYKIWDVEKKCWFVPRHPDRKKNLITEEILFSQAGDMFYHINRGDNHVPIGEFTQSELKHVTEELFRPYRYTTSKSQEGQKIYEGDIVRLEHIDNTGEVKWYDGSGFLIKLDNDGSGENPNPVSFDFGILEVIEHREERLLKKQQEKVQTES